MQVFTRKSNGTIYQGMPSPVVDQAWLDLYNGMSPNPKTIERALDFSNFQISGYRRYRSRKRSSCLTRRQLFPEMKRITSYRFLCSTSYIVSQVSSLTLLRTERHTVKTTEHYTQDALFRLLHGPSNRLHCWHFARRSKRSPEPLHRGHSAKLALFFRYQVSEYSFLPKCKDTHLT